MLLATSAHRITAGIKGSQYVSLRSQMICCAMSITANIAEGRAQRSDREYARFLGYSLVSANELESHLLLSNRMGLIDDRNCEKAVGLAIEVRKMLHALMRRLDAN